MTVQQPLKQILAATQAQWDRAEIRPAVRRNLRKVLNCRTPALGAEVFASETEEKLVYHTCKSRACPSCGHRATLLWQREQYAALPDIPYVGITFTMPSTLWPLFRHDRRLLHNLAALGAAVIQQWAKVSYGVRVLVLVVPHTFGRHLNFNVHLHVLVSAGGLNEADCSWVPYLQYNKKALMHMWRFAVITYLRKALAAGILQSELDSEALKADLKRQYERWWNIHVDHFKSKAQFLRYAGRYVRRPPIAQHRFVNITGPEVEFLTKDLRQKRMVVTRYQKEDFVSALAEHVPDHYRHTVRHFGLLAPRSKARTFAAVLAVLGQKARPRPQRLSWADSLRRYFGVDPLVDRAGRPMHRVRRLGARL